MIESPVIPRVVRSSRAPRVLLYSHDGLGLGHTRRNLAIADALTSAAPSAAVLMATGLEEIARLGLPQNVGMLKLPGVKKVANGRYEPRRISLPLRDVIGIRAALLRAAVESFRPDVLLADKHPLGIDGELLPALEALRGAGGYAVLGLRDILDAPSRVRTEWAAHDLLGCIAQHYEKVLVYGCRNVFDATEAYEFPAEITLRTEFCGYVVNRIRRVWRASDALPIPEGETRPVVLATPGGGEDGFPLLERFIQAAAGAPWYGIAVTGPATTEARRKILLGMADEAGVAFRSFVPGLASWFPRVDALVCMAGYNTIAEGLSTGTPIVSVPRNRPRTEQLIRARGFQQLGLVQMVEPESLDVERLRRAIDAALGVSRVALLEKVRTIADFAGAQNAAECLLSLASRRAERPVGKAVR